MMALGGLTYTLGGGGFFKYIGVAKKAKFKSQPGNFIIQKLGLREEEMVRTLKSPCSV